MSPIETTPDAPLPKGAPVPGLHSDPRWHLVECILLTVPFQKSANLHALLSYLAEYSIRGKAEALTERQIGIAVFGKPVGYSPAEDSAVRVHIRQLRLRLHEYFAQEGRNATQRVEIPKGTYSLEFQDVVPEAVPLSTPTLVVSPEPARPAKSRGREAMFWIAIVAAAVCAAGWYRAARATPDAHVPWPINAIIQPDRQTRVVVSDSRLILRLLSNRETTLDEYLQPDYRKKLIPSHLPDNVMRMMDFISESQLTSFADLTTVAALIRLAGPESTHIVLTSARDLDRRDLEHGNYVFAGSPTSNPWVALFADKLNFQQVEETVGGRTYFRNRNPLAGEQKEYEGLASTGSTGEDYATISLLPGEMDQGNVMILQGLHQEGTEALSSLLSDANDRTLLEKAVRNIVKSNSPYFEALVRSRAVAGAPVSVEIVAVRSIQP
jgi:hypothetical protein